MVVSAESWRWQASSQPIGTGSGSLGSLRLHKEESLLDDLGDVNDDEGFHLDDTVDTNLPVDLGDEEPEEGEVESDEDDVDYGDNEEPRAGQAPRQGCQNHQQAVPGLDSRRQMGDGRT